jgi:signal transduction histidine kinase
MSAPSKLVRPIYGEVASDGRLLRADEALVRLNQRAGGSEGGLLAIPALANLASLSVRLQMRLSRAVRVADGAENLELWVEVEPEPTLAKIAIVSWQILPSTVTPKDIAVDVSPLQIGILRFDAALRLVRANGLAAQGLAPADFGRDGAEVLGTIFEDAPELATLLEAMSDRAIGGPFAVRRQFDGQCLTVSGRPLLGTDAADGYECRFEPAAAIAATPSAARADQAALFGKHLAPALRQPLGRIIANAETIGSELQGPIRENYALYARDIANAARHLSALVDDLGDLEAVERADFKTARDDIELGDVARRVVGLLALKAADHSIRVDAPAESDKVPAVAEFRRTLQILLNLVNNAIRYSPDGTAIRIEIETVGNAALVSVIDQGAGVAPEDREKIFEKFERLGRSGDGGSGLGLYISRRLARAMGGELAVFEAEGGGARFTLRLPNS